MGKEIQYLYCSEVVSHTEILLHGGKTISGSSRVT